MGCGPAVCNAGDDAVANRVALVAARPPVPRARVHTTRVAPLQAGFAALHGAFLAQMLARWGAMQQQPGGDTAPSVRAPSLPIQKN